MHLDAGRIIVVLLAVASSHAGQGLARDLRADPASGRIRVIYMGDAIGVSNPFPILQGDPLLSCTAVYACTIHQTSEQIKKSVRAYMPRTYSRFLDNDVIILSDANRDAFRSEHFTWFKRGVLDEGMGLVMIGGAESFANPSWPSWQPTDVADVLPCEMVEAVPRVSGGSVKVVDWEDEFIRSLPFNKLGPYGSFSGHNMILPRITARLIAVLVHVGVGESPFLMWWDIGKGRTMAQSADWTPAGGSVFVRWQYYGDYAVNMMLFLAGQNLPDDLETLYAVRRRMRAASEAMLTLQTMMDFVERLGGNTNALLKGLAPIREKRKEAMSLYLKCDLDGAAQGFEEVIRLCDAAMENAIKARDAAAFYLFLVEWASVTGILLLGGSFLWIIMVRRRLYREVATTKLIEA